MNKRLKELELQAYIEFTRWEIDPPSGYKVSHTGKEFSREKFAELIVKECIQLIENTIQTKCDTDNEKMGCEFAITELQEHFGVD